MQADYPDWQVEVIQPEMTTKATWQTCCLERMPGFVLQCGSWCALQPWRPRQLRHQGASYAGWPGRKLRTLTEKMYFSADDIDPDANLSGMIAFIFAAMGRYARVDNFYRQAFGSARELALTHLWPNYRLSCSAIRKGGIGGLYSC